MAFQWPSGRAEPTGGILYLVSCSPRGVTILRSPCDGVVARWVLSVNPGVNPSPCPVRIAEDAPRGPPPALVGSRWLPRGFQGWPRPVRGPWRVPPLQPTALSRTGRRQLWIWRHGRLSTVHTGKHWTLAMVPRLRGRFRRTIELSESRLASPMPVGFRRPPSRRLASSPTR